MFCQEPKRLTYHPSDCLSFEVTSKQSLLFPEEQRERVRMLCQCFWECSDSQEVGRPVWLFADVAPEESHHSGPWVWHVALPGQRTLKKTYGLGGLVET